MSLPLAPLKVIELNPDPVSSFCGTILSDFGAEVITINHPTDSNSLIPYENNFLNRGKKSIVLDIKLQSHVKIFTTMIQKIDVLIESNQPGFLETLGFDPRELLRRNPKLIICRISGYGQTGSFSKKAGQDINFLATSGLLSTFGTKENHPEFPGNIMSIGGGSVMGAIGILMAVMEREKTGRGQVIDNSITESLMYLNSFVLNLKRMNFWNKARGENLLDSGAPFYRVYECKDRVYLSVGAIEPKFYQDFIKGLALDKETEEKCLDNHLNQDMWDEMHQIFKQRILEKTGEEWKKIYENLDACTCLVLNFEDLGNNPYHLERKNIFADSFNNSIPPQLQYQTTPAPKLSNHQYSKHHVIRKVPKVGGNTYDVMKEFNVDSQTIQDYYREIAAKGAKLPLYQIKVLELEGLAPTLMTGMILADFGADVITINRPDEPVLNIQNGKNILNRGKRSVVLNLKKKLHIEIVKKMIAGSDVLIDPYRPGVLEKMGLSPEECFKINKRIVICRLTGYGQTGPLAIKAGHDLNYLANSGVVSTFGTKKSVLGFPNNILADFMGGGAMAAFGVLAALFERIRTGKGQVVDNSMTESSLYLGSYILSLKRNGLWNNPRGENIYDSGAPFYNIYQCKDQKYLTVAAVERITYSKFIHSLNLSTESERICLENQYNNSKWDEIHKILSEKIASKSLEEWTSTFAEMNVCVTPVVNMEEVPNYPLFEQRNSVIKENNPDGEIVKEFQFQISPSPKFSNHPQIAQNNKKIPSIGENTLEVLTEFRIEKNDIDALLNDLQPKL